MTVCQVLGHNLHGLDNRLNHIKDMLRPGVSGLTRADLTIMAGALELHKLTVKDVMVPLDEGCLS